MGMFRKPGRNGLCLAVLAMALCWSGCGGGGAGAGSSQPSGPAWTRPIQNVQGINLGPAAYSETLLPVFRSGPDGYQIGSWRENTIVGGQSQYKVMVSVGTQGSWSSPVQASVSSLGYDLAVGPSGSAVLGTYEADQAGGPGYAFTLRRRVGGVWETTGVPMEAPKFGSSFSPDPVPKIAMDAGGNAVAIWRSWSNPSQLLATRWMGTAWSPAQVLAEEVPSARYIRDIGLSVSQSGEAIIWWTELRTGEAALRTTRWVKGLDPEPPATVGVPGLNGPGTVRYPNAGVEILWLRDGSPILGRYAPTGAFDVSAWVGGGWSDPVSLPPLPGQGVDVAFQLVAHHLALDPSGSPQAIWIANAAAGSVQVTAAGYAKSGWSAPRILGTSDVQYGGATLSLDPHPDGSLAIAWGCGVPDSFQEPITPIRIGEMVWSAQGPGPVRTPIGTNQSIRAIRILNLGGGRAQVVWCILGPGGTTWTISVSSVS